MGAVQFMDYCTTFVDARNGLMKLL